MSTRKTKKTKKVTAKKKTGRRKAKKTVGANRTVAKATGKVDRKVYGAQTKVTFQEKIMKLRAGNKRTGVLTYGAIAQKLNALGFKNRDRKEITPQFVGNILNRLTDSQKAQLQSNIEKIRS